MRCSLPVVSLFLAASLCAFGQAPPAAADQTAVSQAANPTSAASASDQKDFSPKEPSRWHFHLGAVTVGGGYFSDPFFPYGPYPNDNYGPYPYSPFTEPKYSATALWVPYAPGGPARHPLDLAYKGHRGEIKLVANPETAEVYIDGSFAGTASRLKRIWLDPGAYDLAVSSPGLPSYHQRLYVLTGKTLKVDAQLSQAN